MLVSTNFQISLLVDFRVLVCYVKSVLFFINFIPSIFYHSPMNTLFATMLSNWFFRASLNLIGFGNGPWDLSRLHQTFYVTLVEKVNRLFTLEETEVNDVDDQGR